MTLREALKKINKEKFNLNYNDNNYWWALTIFNKDLEPVYELKEYKYLSDVLSAYFNEEVETTVEMYYTADNINKMAQLNFSNFNTEENFFYISSEDFKTSYSIKILDELIENLENLDGVTDNFEQNEENNRYEKQFPYESRGLSIRDFI